MRLELRLRTRLHKLIVGTSGNHTIRRKRGEIMGAFGAFPLLMPPDLTYDIDDSMDSIPTFGEELLSLTLVRITGC